MTAARLKAIDRDVQPCAQPLAPVRPGDALVILPAPNFVTGDGAMTGKPV
jgi:hypothetical protein